MKKPIVAVCYDFDKTLATNDMQTFKFIPSLGLQPNEFWKMCRDFSVENNGMDATLCFMRVMMRECEKRGIPMTRNYLMECGKYVEFFNGVESWFERINAYGKKHGVEVEHYLITTGNKEIVEGCPIHKEFKYIYGSEYLYNENGVAYWPRTIVNYTLKTQHLFRISKGFMDLSDETSVNQRVEHKHVPFENMVYVGDGFTDIPCMAIVKEKGGVAISVYPQGYDEVSKKLVSDDRVNYACLADYGENSEIEKVLKSFIDHHATK